MCRWIAYSGGPVYLEELLFKPRHSLIHQSLAARAGETTTNGDGFGVGWYGTANVPGVYKNVQPAWSDENLLNLCAQIKSPLFMAHIRATTGTPVQQTNCHPFRYGQWLFQHNGVIQDFARIKRELVLAIAPRLFPRIGGSTDSEVMFFLALTFGLEQDAIAAVERMAGFIEDVGRRHGIAHPLQMTLAIMDGEVLYAFRYSSERRSRSLFHSASMETLRRHFPNVDTFSNDARAVVSEPLGSPEHAAKVWIEVPESSALIVRAGKVDVIPMQPRTELAA